MMTTYNDLSANSRVWIYQSNREFSDYEAISIRGKINQFVQQWVAHSDKVKGFGDLYHNRFVVLFADEEQVGVSGCSIDSSVKFIKQLGQEYQVDFFDRFNIAYSVNEGVNSLPKMEFEAEISNGNVTPETLVFNNLVSSKAEFEKQWHVPMKESWHANVFG